MRMTGTLDLGKRLAHAPHQQRRHKAREEAAGPDDHGVESADRVGHRGHDVRFGRQPHAPHLVAQVLPRVHLDLAARGRAVAVFGADCGGLDADGPHAPLAAEQTSQPVHRGQEVARVLRPSSRAAGCRRYGRPRRSWCSIVGRRDSRHAPGFAFVPRQRERALQDVAGRQHAEFVAELARTAAAVEHGDDRVQAQPRVALETAEQARQAGAAADAPDVQLAKPHAGHSIGGRGASPAQGCPAWAARGASADDPDRSRRRRSHAYMRVMSATWQALGRPAAGRPSRPVRARLQSIVAFGRALRATTTRPWPRSSW